MNFTREPIIETIISAREGYKLSLKSSKTVAGEEHLVDALEVVSFGGSFFYRCSEKPKPFFFPACDYEIVEVRETRLLIKSASLEKAIKIAGGKDPARPQHHHHHNKPEVAQLEDEEEERAVSPEEVPQQAPRQEQKRDKKRHRKKKGNREDRSSSMSQQSQQPAIPGQSKEGEAATPVVATTPLYSHLLRPPESLISESLQKKYRREDALTAPEVASTITPNNEEIVTSWVKSDETTFTEEITADAQLTSEPPHPRDRLEEDHHDDSLLHLSFPDFEDRL